jgi:hypothetical protein
MQPRPILTPMTEKTDAVAYPYTGSGGNVIPIKPFWPLKGPNGYPNYIRAFNVHFEVQVDTDGSASVDSPDWWRWLNGVSIVMVNGQRRFPGDMTGDQILAALEEFAGVEQLKFHPDIAVSQSNATRKMTFRIPMTSPYVFEGDDDEVLADLITRLELKPPDLSSAGVAVAGGVITLDSMTIRIEAEVQERDYLVWPSGLEFVAIPFSGSDASLTTGALNCRVMAALIHKRGAGGGASLSNLTSVLLPGMWPEHLKRDPDLKENFLAKRGWAAGTAATDQGVSRVASLVATDRLCPVIFADEMEKAWSGDIVKELTVKTVEASAISDKVLLLRKRLPRDLAIHKAIAKKYNKGLPLPFQLRTKGKTRRKPEQWPESMSDYMPKIAPVPGLPGYKNTGRKGG